ncbi:MAG: tandem-95 repeat protein [Cyclobacteriaceae bacterium]
MLLLHLALAVKGQEENPPQLSGTSEEISYREGNPAVAVLPELTISDEENDALLLMTASFGDTYNPQEDRLILPERENIASHFDVAQGVMKIYALPATTGLDIADFQTVVRELQYINLNDAKPAARSLPLSVTVTDLTGQTSSAFSKTITVTPVNDPPVISSPNTASANASPPRRNIDIFSAVTITEPEDQLLSRAVIEISSGFVPGYDQLGINGDDAGLRVSISERVVTFTGNADAATYAEAIENVIYNSNVLEDREVGIRLVTARVYDISGAESQALGKYLVIQPLKGRINSPPYIQAASVKTSENEAYNFVAEDFSKEFQDVDGDDFRSIRIGSRPAHGELYLGEELINNQFILSGQTISAGNIEDLRYEPDPFYNGTDRFEWNATDGENFTANPAPMNIEVEPVNQPGQLSAPEEISLDEDASVAIALTFSDPDQGSASAELKVNNGGIFLPEIVLSDPALRFESGANGEKSLEISGPMAQLSFALSGLIYRPEPDYSGTDVLTILAGEAGGEKLERSVQITVNEVNDAPLISQLENDALVYEENAPAVNISEQLEVSDPENDQVSSARIFFSQGYRAAEDSLLFDEQSGISASFSDSTLTLSGIASASAYQEALRTVRYINKSENPSVTDKTLSLVLTDSEGADSEPFSRSLQVVPINDLPLISGLEEAALQFVEGRPAVPISSSLQLSDPDDSLLSRAEVRIDTGYAPTQDELIFEDTENISGSFDTENGILTLSGEASLAAYEQALRNVRYRNTAENINTDQARSLSIRVNDGEAFSSSASRAIEIISNTPPEVSGFSLTTDEDQPLAFEAADFPFSDPDNFPNEGNPSRYAITSLPAHGFLLLSGDTITQVEMEQGFNGFEFEIDAADIGELLYQPELNYNGTDSFSWNAFDGAEYAAEDALATIQITAVPDAPIIASFDISTPEDTAYTFRPGDFSAAYQDADGDPLQQVIIRSTPEHGRLLLNNLQLPANSRINRDQLGKLVYQPNSNFFGDDSFSWDAADATQESSSDALVNITVQAVNDAPGISSFTRATSEGENFTFSPEDFSENYLDIENDPLAYILITSLPATGQLLLSDTPLQAGDRVAADELSELIYQAAEGQSSSLSSFGWNASDGQALAADPATVRVIIGIGVTDFSVQTEEDSAYTFQAAQFVNNYGNPDASLQRIRIDRLPENGELTMDGVALSAQQEVELSSLSGLVYQPSANYNGADSLAWSASAGEGFTENSAQVFINILSVNDAPQISGLRDLTLFAGEESQILNLSLSDVDSEASTFELSVLSLDENLVPNDQLQLSGEGSNWTLSISAAEGVAGEATISLLASDGDAQSQQSFTVLVQPYRLSFDLPDSEELCLGQNGEIELAISGGQAPYTLEASCDQPACDITFADGLLSFSSEENITYYISFIDANGVSSLTDTLAVEVIDCSQLALEIPSGFTPNGDGVNDLWEIQNIAFYENVVVEVFNRYGASLFYSEGYRNAWDGSYENQPLPTGTYYYMISIDGGAQHYSGTVSILR